jgi:hypothetical protein
MLIDCDSCVVKGTACGGCVVSVMLGTAPAGVELDEAEQRALAVLADAELVPHLRLVTADQPGSPGPSDWPGPPNQPGPGAPDWPDPGSALLRRIA